MTNHYHDRPMNQSELLDVIKMKLNIGKNKAMYLLMDLNRYGLAEYTLGGRNNVEKIWSIK